MRFAISCLAIIGGFVIGFSIDGFPLAVIVAVVLDSIVHDLYLRQ